MSLHLHPPGRRLARRLLTAGLAAVLPSRSARADPRAVRRRRAPRPRAARPGPRPRAPPLPPSSAATFRRGQRLRCGDCIIPGGDPQCLRHDGHPRRTGEGGGDRLHRGRHRPGAGRRTGRFPGVRAGLCQRSSARGPTVAERRNPHRPHHVGAELRADRLAAAGSDHRSEPGVTEADYAPAHGHRADPGPAGRVRRLRRAADGSGHADRSGAGQGRRRSTTLGADVQTQVAAAAAANPEFAGKTFSAVWPRPEGAGWFAWTAIDPRVGAADRPRPHA